LPPRADLTGLLAELVQRGLRFVLVGGLAAVSQGAPFLTRDVDIVHARDDANLDALLAFLSDVHARYRGRPGPPLAPARAGLAGTGHHLLMTDLGPLDVLGAIEGGRDYDALLAESLDVPFRGAMVKMLSLESILRWKRSSAVAKDKLMVPVLEATLRRLRGG
jgi:hypothetical protein